MRLIKKFIPIILFYLVLGTTFFLPNSISTAIVIIDFVLFIGFLVALSHRANLELKNNKSDSFWNLFISIATFGVIQIVLLYGLIVWIVL